MAEIVGIRFKDVGKIYYFSPQGKKLQIGEKVIVETVRGVECGMVAIANREENDDNITSPLKPIIRLATKEDEKQLLVIAEKEKEAFKICEQKIAEHALEMKLVNIEYTFDCNKILFYFTSEGRVDFRELVKDLASVFRTRIELRQIGVRDEAKMLGGIAVCGREFCCSSFLGEFQPVSIKMAKEQGLSLNPTKISGSCGRLMCCLKYEQSSYEHLLKTTPKAGAIVATSDGKGVVTEVSLLTGFIKVSFEKSGGGIKPFHKTEVKILKDGYIKVDRDEAQSLKGLEK